MHKGSPKATHAQTRCGSLGATLKKIGVWLMRSGRSLCTRVGPDSDFQATASMEAAAEAPASAKRSTLAALTGAFDARPNSRRALRHLHIVEQTIEVSGWRLDLVPLAVLQKALLELRVLAGGSARDPALDRVRDRLQQHIFRTDLSTFIAANSARTRWRPSEFEGQKGEVFFGEDMPTQPMGLVDVPLDMTTEPARLAA